MPPQEVEEYVRLREVVQAGSEHVMQRLEAMLPETKRRDKEDPTSDRAV
jgi:hypothetical protein